MTAERLQRRSRKGNGSRRIAFAAGSEESGLRAPVCLPLAASGKLAGFGIAAAPSIQRPAPPLPIWFAALLATHCQAKAGGQGRDVRWRSVSGRAVYTNDGVEAETIEPLGVYLQVGHTVAVSWIAGETSYTVEVFRKFDCVA